MTRLWWQDPFRMFQTNLREIDAGLDVEEVLDYLVEFGADTWLLSVGGILSNYPTDLEFQTRNPYLAQRASGDLVGDAVKAANRRGVRVMGRMDFSKIDHRRAEQHPDWCFVDAAGDPQVYNGLTSVCPSGGYYQVKLFEVLDEVLDRYPIDGFFCNWMSFNEVDYSRRYRGVCHCLACTTRYAEYAPGESLPEGKESPGYETWQRFAREVLADLTGRIRDHLARRRPEAPLVLGDRADIVFHEANNAVGRPLWHHRTSEHVSAAKTYRPTVPVLTNSVGFVDMPYRSAGEEPHHFAQYLLQAIARGANPSTYIMGTPSDSPYACLKIAGELTRFHRDHHEVYRELVPAAETLLVRPDQFKHGAAREFQGLYLALLQRHVPFDVLPEERIAEVDLSRYRAVVLPDLGSLSPSASPAIDSYCEAGGAVVATGNSGVVADAIRLRCLPARRRLASHDTEEATRSLHLRGDSEIVPVVGAFDLVEPKPEAELGLLALSRAPYGPPEKCHGHWELDHPGRLRARYGEGRAVMLPWTVGRAYREVGLSAHRDLFVDDVMWAGGPQVESGLPEQVEIVVGRSAAGTVIHLLNRSGDADQRFAEPLPIARTWLAVPGTAVEVEALRAGERLPVVDGRMQLPEIGLFEVLVVRS
ncbi:beta-galactosidase-like protein [Kribbella sp. VKM Ac-2527]|uniref:Beta-galactosidase-like protein n=1 Tax=Kribbella caucasensis TaxID=2512215 RepID=A0A4R6JL09_9ACTN|nr:alpha-amylase family protein [Kribbella sp. VKM Ac-2527]TDO35235.1 beta-galactosidase-like protein [Kribbella sp. VKM Ac-2527]